MSGPAIAGFHIDSHVVGCAFCLFLGGLCPIPWFSTATDPLDLCVSPVLGAEFAVLKRIVQTQRAAGV